MAQKAILFDSSRCTGCQACAAACGKVRRTPLPGVPAADRGPHEGAAVADDYERTADLDGGAVLAVTFRERTVEGHGLVWEVGRKSCVHCASAPCAEVCPTGALARDEETGLVLAHSGRCVSCFLCSLACPVDVPRPGGAGGAVAKCDGCVGRVRGDLPPLCVEACPLDALAWGDREEMIAQANDRMGWLQERGYGRACVLGVSEQGGHGVIQVLKYGVDGGDHAPLASTGSEAWVDGVKMAGPVSVGVLGALGAAAVGALAWETAKEQRARAAAKVAPIGMVGGVAEEGSVDGFNGAVATEGVEDAAYLDGAFTDEDVAREAEVRAAAEAREAEMQARMPRIVAATPAAAAAATAAERHLYPVAFDEDDGADAGDDDAEAVLPEVDELGDTGEIPLIVVDELSDTGEIPVIEVDELGDTGEIPVIDEKSDTGELYNLEDFQRLLAADIVAHHLAKEAVAENASEEVGQPDDFESAQLDGTAPDSDQPDDADDDSDVAQSDGIGGNVVRSDCVDGDAAQSSGVSDETS